MSEIEIPKEILKTKLLKNNTIKERLLTNIIVKSNLIQ